ncbi:MAG: CDP-glycerol glycerophosphotransferase family protein [Deltaproteobacteria bacterium]
MSRLGDATMRKLRKRRILFCGYAPVHFVCFQPINARLSRIPFIDISYFVGQPARSEDTLTTQGTDRILRSFRIPSRRILSLERMRRESFDMVICGFVSGAFPKSDRTRIHLFHGVSFRNMAVRRDILIYDYLFNVGLYQMRLFREHGLIRDGDRRMVPVGFPKLDRMVNGALDRVTILRRLGLSGRRPVILYAPTGQKNNSLETVGEEVIHRLREAGCYDLLIKPHDHPRDKTIDWSKRLLAFEDAHTKVVRDFDIVPSLFVSDLLISDASSVSAEYSLLDRPMVFIDVPQMIAAAQEKGASLDLDTWGRKGGEVAQWPDEVVEAVRWSLAHPNAKSSVRKAMARDMFFYPGHATEKGVEWILNWFAMNSE